jgi:tRNA1Val (adenine37-N6)-methyltransferase
MKVGTDAVLLGAWTDLKNAERILDIGTGSGVIALMLAQRSGNSVHIDAIDNAKDDFNQAQENFLRSPWNARIHAYHETLQHFNPEYQYDCIVSNPPFFSNSLEPPDEKRKKVRHTSTLSFRELLASCSRLLKPAGHLSLILPFVEGSQFIPLASDIGIYCRRKTSFRTRQGKPIERLLLELTRDNGAKVESEILLYKEANTFSEEYRSLTQDFYINF